MVSAVCIGGPKEALGASVLCVCDQNTGSGAEFALLWGEARSMEGGPEAIGETPPSAL